MAIDHPVANAINPEMYTKVLRKFGGEKAQGFSIKAFMNFVLDESQCFTLNPTSQIKQWLQKLGYEDNLVNK